MAEACLGLGGNLGDRMAMLEAALAALEAADGIRLRRVSSIYETPPWGPVPQAPYLNACAIVATTLGPRALLEVCLAVERGLGRERVLRWGPRTIDIDLLVYDDAAIDEPGLIVPHPRMLERAFVLVPLAEIAPDRVVRGRSVIEWLTTVDASEVRRAASAPREDWASGGEVSEAKRGPP